MEALFTQKTMVVAQKMDKDGRFNRNASFKSLLGPLDAEQKNVDLKRNSQQQPIDYGSTV